MEDQSQIEDMKMLERYNETVHAHYIQWISC